MRVRKKTGEKREVNLPLKIDRLPASVHEQIQQLRAQGKTWEEIERASRDFVKWNDLPTAVLELFPDLKLPHTNLHRWYDLRVAQVQKEVLAQTESARQFAAAFAGREFKDLDAAVVNALRDTVFSLSTAGTPEKFSDALNEFGWLVARFKQVAVAKQRADAETKRITLLEGELKSKRKQLEKETEKAAAKVGKGRSLTVDDINRIRERTFGLPPVQRSTAAGPAA